MTDPLPALLDCRGIMRETGLTRASAEKLMRSSSIPIVRIPNSRKVFVRRADVLRVLAEGTYGKDEVPT